MVTVRSRASLLCLRWSAHHWSWPRRIRRSTVESCRSASCLDRSDQLSLYLWHWPLLSYLTILRNGVPNFLEVWAALLVSLILSVLTYRLNELPLHSFTPWAAPKLTFGLACIGLIGIATVATSGFEFRFPPQVREIARVRTTDSSAFLDHCFLEAPGAGFDSSCIEPRDKPLLFL